MTNEVFYVGKGSYGGKRGYNRKNEYAIDRRNDKWLRYVEEINHNFTSEIVEEFTEEQEAYDFEYMLQKYYWSIGQCSCCKAYDQEWNNKMKNNCWNNQDRNLKISLTLCGRQVSDETKQKISNTLTGRYCRENNSNKRRVVQLNLDGSYVATFDCIVDAARSVGGYTSHISKCCQGKLKKHKKYIWVYEEDYIRPRKNK